MAYIKERGNNNYFVRVCPCLPLSATQIPSYKFDRSLFERSWRTYEAGYPRYSRAFRR